MYAMISSFDRPHMLVTALLTGVLGLGCAGHENQGDTQPDEGRWILSRGAEVERTCTGSQSPWPLAAEYTLTNTGATSFTLAYPPEMGPVHECTRDGGEFECPPLFIVGDCCSSVEIAFTGMFESATHATGFIISRFDAVTIPGGGATSGGIGTGGPEDCCPDFGSVDPCTLTHSLDAVWEPA